jgi:hypothetical protein
MNSTSSINLPAVISFSAHAVFPAHLVDLDRAVPASGSKRRLAALLSLAASNEFLLVAVGAAFAAVFYQLHPERVGLGRSS